VVRHRAGVAIHAFAAVDSLVDASAVQQVALIRRTWISVIADNGLSDAFAVLAMIPRRATVAVVTTGAREWFEDTTHGRVATVCCTNEFILAILVERF